MCQTSWVERRIEPSITQKLAAGRLGEAWAIGPGLWAKRTTHLAEPSSYASSLRKQPQLSLERSLESPVTASEDWGMVRAVREDQEKAVDRRSWLYRFFFGP